MRKSKQDKYCQNKLALLFQNKDQLLTTKEFLYPMLRFLDQKRFGKLEPEPGNELVSSQFCGRACVEATYIADHAGTPELREIFLSRPDVQLSVEVT